MRNPAEKSEFYDRCSDYGNWPPFGAAGFSVSTDEVGFTPLLRFAPLLVCFNPCWLRIFNCSANDIPPVIIACGGGGGGGGGGAPVLTAGSGGGGGGGGAPVVFTGATLAARGAGGAGGMLLVSGGAGGADPVLFQLVLPKSWCCWNMLLPPLVLELCDALLCCCVSAAALLNVEACWELLLKMEKVSFEKSNIKKIFINIKTISYSHFGIVTTNDFFSANETENDKHEKRGVGVLHCFAKLCDDS